MRAREEELNKKSVTALALKLYCKRKNQEKSECESERRGHKTKRECIALALNYAAKEKNQEKSESESERRGHKTEVEPKMIDY